jgi:predicted nucleotidyltransferase component of viral defense system
MGITTVLSDFQKQVLLLFKKSALAKKFYLAGGTALAEYYLHHRKSEDLDFFTQEELSLPSLKRFVAAIKNRIGLDKIEYQHGFGLYSFFFYPKKEVAKYKVDFGQYPFGPIEPPQKIGGLLVESLFDIAVDKAHTIATRPRLRDFIDLYLILRQNQNWGFEDLLQKGREKFELGVDPLQLGENLIQVTSLSDMPIMLSDIDMKVVRRFFLSKARSLKEKILA